MLSSSNKLIGQYLYGTPADYRYGNDCSGRVYKQGVVLCFVGNFWIHFSYYDLLKLTTMGNIAGFQITVPTQFSFNLVLIYSW